jgi:hypothetical protein
VRADTAKRDRRFAHPLAVVAIAAVFGAGLASCGERASVVNGAVPGASPITSGSAEASASAPPSTKTTTQRTAPHGASGVVTEPAPTSGNSGNPPAESATPPPAPTPFSFPASFAAASPTDAAAVNRSYQAFLTDVAGLDSGFDPGWVTRLRQVATTKLVKAVREVAAGFQKLGDHTEGALHDSHVGIRVHGSRAVLIDCLDEYDWYLVNDKSGDPDPGATRGNFEAFSSFVDTSTGWKVSLWKPGSYACQY